MGICSTVNRSTCDVSDDLPQASAYIGTCLMPPLFGMIANRISIKILPLYLLILRGLMIYMHESLTESRQKDENRVIILTRYGDYAMG